jgi:DDE superfamily endonuclease
MAYTSEKERHAIVAYWELTGSVAGAQKLSKQPVKVVRRWIQRFRDTGAVKDAPKSGRRPLLSAAAGKLALDQLLSGEAGGAKSVARNLHAAGHTTEAVSKQTIVRAASKVAEEGGGKLRALRGKPAQQLSDATMGERLQFCEDNRTRGWGTVIFTDRKKFPFSYPGVKVHPVTWVVEGSKRSRRTARAVNHAQVVNVYAGICKYGVTRFHVVAGTSGHRTAYKNKKGQVARNITASEYEAVVKQTFLPEGTRLFSNHGLSTWTLQQDNDPTHRAAGPIVQQWNAQHASSVSILENWPASSPDLNPIENFWGYLQRKMDAKGCRTFSEYRAALETEARLVPHVYFSKLVGSMPKRMADCIKLEGGKTKR